MSPDAPDVGHLLDLTDPDVVADPYAALAACRATGPTDDADGAERGISALPGLLVARYLGQHGEAARHWFSALWQVLRPSLIGRPAVTPRIWNT